MVKECGATVVNWGSLSRPVCWDSSQNPFVFGDKDFFFPPDRGWTSLTRKFSGKKGEGGGKEFRVTLLCCFLQFLQPKTFDVAKVLCFGVVCPEFHLFLSFLCHLVIIVYFTIFRSP